VKEAKKEEVEESSSKVVTVRALKACLNTEYLKKLGRTPTDVIVVHRDRNAAKNILHLGLGGYIGDRQKRPQAFSRSQPKHA
jgi:transposase